MERQIPKEEWRTFFDQFSRQHDGWLVSLECERIGLTFRELPLRGIVADEYAIEIFAHAADGSHVTHVVQWPKAVISEETVEGGDIAVTIVDEHGQRTVVLFRCAVPAEMVDGVGGTLTSRRHGES